MTREELEQQLRKLIVGCPSRNEDTCPFCHCDCDDDVTAAMALIDQYAATQDGKATVEEWDANQAAAYLGYRNAAAARSTLSRWGIKKVREEQDDGGRMMSLYPAEAIRHEAVRRGRRTCEPATPS